jgi:hypothetical protein
MCCVKREQSWIQQRTDRMCAVYHSTKVYSTKRVNPTTKPALHQDYHVPSDTRDTCSILQSTPKHSLILFQPETTCDPDHQRVEHLAPGLWNQFPSVQPPVAHRIICRRSMDMSAAARESDEPNFSSKRATDQEVINELRMLWTERTIQRVTDVVLVAAFRGPALSQHEKPHEKMHLLGTHTFQSSLEPRMEVCPLHNAL